MSSTQRLENEKEFHNKIFLKKKFVINRFYLATEDVKNYFRSKIALNCEGKCILEYGCGSWAESIRYAEKGAIVHAIDISDTAIELGRKKAEEAGFSDKMTFEVMNAEKMTFNENKFDVIHGMGIIHHLDIDNSYREISRVLKKDGFAIFMEPLGYNPLINLFRILTPKIRTVDEHPLLISDFEHAKRYFRKVDVKYYFIFSPVAEIFPGVIRKPLKNIMKKIDRFILRIPSIRKYAWVCILELSQPYTQ